MPCAPAGGRTTVSRSGCSEMTIYNPPATLSSLPAGIWSGVDSLPVFPYLPGQLPSVSKSPSFSASVLKSASGRRRVTSYWPFPIWLFEVGWEVLRHKPSNDELAILWEFFNTMQGQGGNFLLVDPTDCQILSSAPVNFGTGDGATTVFQLSRILNATSISAVSTPLKEPVSNVFSPTILDNGVASTHVANTNNGQVTFNVAPTNGHALTWYGYFYFGCCFTQDNLTLQQIVQLLWEGKSLKMESLRV